MTEAEYLGYDGVAGTQDFRVRYGLRGESVQLDNDDDHRWDEDPADGLDNDQDGAVDEDGPDPADASAGEVVVYDPEFETQAFDLSTLSCQTHGAADGLHATLAGIQHAVVVKVPASFLGKAGDYHFVLRVKDAHGHLEKGHREKWALERNQTRRQFPAANFSPWMAGNLEPLAKMAAKNQREVYSLEAGEWKRSHYGKWKYWNGTAWVHKDMETFTGSSPFGCEAFGSLKRVAVWSINTSSQDIPGFVLWCGHDGPAKVAIVANDDHDAELAQLGYTTLYHINNEDEVQDLNQAMCIFIFCCHLAGSTESALVQAVHAEGAAWAGTIVGGHVNYEDGKVIYPVFWERASGNWIDPQTGQRVLQDMPTALYAARRVRDAQGWSYPNEGPFREYSLGGGYLTPARGGRSDEELVTMGGLP